MAYPSVEVEIAFANSPYAGTGITWVSVTQWLREVTVRRGRSDEFQDFDTGTATIVLDNRDRRFDPLNTSSPYHPNVQPRKQIKISAVNGLTTHEVFRGYVDGWPVSITDAGFDSTVTIECYDVLGLLAEEELPDDLADSYIRSLAPLHYWPLNDPIDGVNYTTQRLQDYGSRAQPLTPGGTFRTANCDGLAVGLADTAVSVAETEFVNAWRFSTGPFTPSSGLGSLSVWFQAPAADSVVVADWGLRASCNTVYDSTTSQLLVQMLDGTNLRDYVGTISLDLSISHHLVVNTNQTSATVVSVYVDAQPVTMTLSSTTSFAN
jgi:hypothetical protein